MSGFNKIIRLDERFPQTGEPTVQPVVLWGLRGKACWEPLSKEASASPAIEYIKSVTPVPGRTIVLILGLGSYEWYGLNRNGDGFSEQAYKVGVKPTCGCCEPKGAWVTEEECIQHHFHTYEQGLVYRNHVNRDPKRAVGKVLKAFWNPFMHRVEVLEDLDNEKAPDLAEQIADGDFGAKSMGCFLADTRITVPNGHVPIQNITVDDVVLSGKGEWRKVTETHERHYAGKIYSVHTAMGTSTATAEHPYAVLRAPVVEEVVKGTSHTRRRDPSAISLKQMEWVHAECLEVGDYLVTPFDTTVKETLTYDQCRLLGYYVSEGHVVYQNNQLQGVEFNHHRDDVATTELPELLKRLAPELPVHQHARHTSTCAVHTYSYSREIARLCIKHCGKYANNKRLSLELLQQPKTLQLAFLGAWINGDGGSCSTGDFYISSCNASLVNQAQQVGFRCELYSRFNVIQHKPSPIVNKNTTEYRADFARRGCNIIAPYTAKVTTREMRSTSTGPFFLPGAVVSKIKDISAWHFEGKVYNFEVAQDESYVAENHAVHNCRIKYDVCVRCGHRSPTRQQYCDHAKFELGRLSPDGLRNGVLNPSPRFFDSSWVVRPADRTGYMLKKVAEDLIYDVRSSADLGAAVDDLNQKAAAAQKLAVIDKVIRGYPAGVVHGVPEASLVEKYRNEILPTVVERTSPLGRGDLHNLAAHGMPETLGELSRAGILLTTPEFITIFLEKALPGVEIPAEVLDNLTAMQGEIFDLFGKQPAFLDKTLGGLGRAEGPSFSEQKLAGLVESLREKRATVSEYLHREAIPASMRLNEPAMSDLMTAVDPETGRVFQTTQGAARAGHDAIAKGQLIKVLGAAGLLAGGYKVLSAFPMLRPAALPLTAAGGIAGWNVVRPDMGPTYATDSGDVPYWTEFQEKRSSLLNTINTLGMDYEITKTGSQLLKRVKNTSVQKLLSKTSSFGLRTTPTLSDLTNSTKIASDDISGDDLDFEKVSELVGGIACGIYPV